MIMETQIADLAIIGAGKFAPPISLDSLPYMFIRSFCS